jgi:hypothetical protein
MSDMGDLSYYAIKATFIAACGQAAGQAMASACFEHAKHTIVMRGTLREVPHPQRLEWAASVAAEKMAATPGLAEQPGAYIRAALKNAFMDAAKAESGGRIVQRNRKRQEAYDVITLNDHAPHLVELSRRAFEEQLAKVLAKVDNEPDYGEQLEKLVDAFYAWQRDLIGDRAEQAEQVIRNGRSQYDVASEYGVSRDEVRRAVADMRARLGLAFEPLTTAVRARDARG